MPLKMINPLASHQERLGNQRNAKTDAIKKSPKEMKGLNTGDNLMNNYTSNLLKILDKILFCSGVGQYHTNAPTAQNRKPYDRVTWKDILNMLVNPLSVDKTRAQWVIFSNQYGEHARNAEYLRNEAKYHALWVDIDERGHSKQELINTVKRFDCLSFIYTTKSANADAQKWRVLIPLAEPVGGVKFELMQTAINNVFTENKIIPDRASQRVNQVCYLPNKGEYYDFEIIEGIALSSDYFDSAIESIQFEKEKERTEIEAYREASRAKQALRVQSGELSPIDAYNSAYSIESEMQVNGYIKQGKRWLSPNSESGIAGVSIKDGKWFTQHQSDIDLGLSKFGDAFDLFKFYKCGNDQNTALIKAGEMFGTTKANQINYMEMQADALDYFEQYNEDDYWNQQAELAQNEVQTQPKTQPQPLGPLITEQPRDLQSFQNKYSLSNFVLNGKSEQMKAQLLDDKFILGKLAILGQGTVFYAKPNSGKTLLTLWLIMQGIKSGELNASDVFYVNADDTYKGLVYKLELAEQYGFNMLAPGQNGFKAESLGGILNELIITKVARGKVIVLDTVKKFTDLMNKESSSKFAELMRQFIVNGGSFILLAHTNKHRDDGGQLVFSGTSDLVDDLDCAYTIDVISNSNGVKVIEFENFKNRGDVASKVSYEYDASTGASYKKKLDSIKEIGANEIDSFKESNALNKQYENDKDVINSIIQSIYSNPDILKTDLINEVKEDLGATPQKIRQVLKRYAGEDINKKHQWKECKGIHNKTNYELTMWASIEARRLLTPSQSDGGDSLKS